MSWKGRPTLMASMAYSTVLVSSYSDSVISFSGVLSIGAYLETDDPREISLNSLQTLEVV